MTYDLLAQVGTPLPVDESLSHFSDLSFRTAWAFYTIALVFSLVHYATQRSRAVVPTRPRELVTAGVGESAPSGSHAVLESSSSPSDPTDDDAAAGDGGRWARLGLLFTVLGFCFHVGSLVLRGLATSRVPWGNLYEFVTLTCALGIAVALVALRRPALRVVWPFVLVPVLILMFVAATKLYAVAAPVVPALRSYWLPIHVSVVSLGSGFFLVSGAASVLFLLRSWMPRGKEHGRLAGLVRPLPAADTLDRLAYQTAVIGFPVFGVGVLLGALWAESAWGRFWGWDPKETTCFITWVVYAGYLHARATSGWGARRAAWINIAGFVAMLFNLFLINIVVSGLHSYAGLN